MSKEMKVIEGEVIQQGATSVPINMESLMSMAVTQGGIETLERLMVIRREMKAEYVKERYFLALANFQKECPTIKRTKPVKNKDKTVKYCYAPLESIVEQVKNVLQENGFSYTLKPTQTKDELTMTCEAHHILGHTELTKMTVPIGSDYMTAQQQVGAALTFAKRYAFCDAFGIMTGDEDTDTNTDETEEPAKTQDTKKTETEKPKEKPPVDPDLLNFQKEVNEALKEKFKDCDVSAEEKTGIFRTLYLKAFAMCNKKSVEGVGEYDKKIINLATSALDIPNPKILSPLLDLCKDYHVGDKL
jgi:hypothetical protein